MARIDHITLHADTTGTLELVCERAASKAGHRTNSYVPHSLSTPTVNESSQS
jgi:hypothetical protein